MSEIITVQGYRLKVETGDEIYVEKHMCGRCDSEHTKISVSRNGKEIASLGDDITLYGEDEVYGGVFVDKDGNALPDPHWTVHIIPNDGGGMTADKMYYVGMCGEVLNRSPENQHDRMTFPSEMRFIDSKHKNRICPECLERYNDRNTGVGSSKTK